MAKWNDKYELVGIQPGKVILKNGREIDFSDPNLKLETVEEAYKTGTRFLKPKGVKPSKTVDKTPPAE